VFWNLGSFLADDADFLPAALAVDFASLKVVNSARRTSFMPLWDETDVRM
jgi:hypothetical protein